MTRKLFDVTYQYKDPIDPDGLETVTDLVVEGHSQEFIKEGKRRYGKSFKVIKVEPNTDEMFDSNGKTIPFKLDRQFGSGHNITIPNKYFWESWRNQYETVTELIEWFEDNKPAFSTDVLWNIIHKRLKVEVPYRKDYDTYLPKKEKPVFVRNDLSEKQVGLINKLIDNYNVNLKQINYYTH